jgi:predicted acetyltransferase
MTTSSPRPQATAAIASGIGREAARTSLVVPTLALLPVYAAALERGWTPDNVRGEVANREALDRIAADPEGFVALTENRLGGGPPVTLADGSQVPRVPSLQRWVWDAADRGPAGFVGLINLRWNYGHAPLPPHVLGHVGYSLVPWQRQRGHGTRALGLLLPLARELGMDHIELTTDPDNEPSQKVILANGGVLLGRFDKGAVYGHSPGLRFRIELGRVAR